MELGVGPCRHSWVRWASGHVGLCWPGISPRCVVLCWHDSPPVRPRHGLGHDMSSSCHVGLDPARLDGWCHACCRHRPVAVELQIRRRHDMRRRRRLIAEVRPLTYLHDRLRSSATVGCAPAPRGCRAVRGNNKEVKEEKVQWVRRARRMTTQRWW